MYPGVDMTWYFQRDCCVIKENRILGENNISGAVCLNNLEMQGN